ncbi:MAG TPA: hypothetical protein VKQ34_03245 [Candidatus Saccharimonadales bacterium]|nr:hypothetical protein [Candidatus Saccharimonadales bacterium]
MMQLARKLIRPVDDLLNAITMYRLVLYGLIVLVIAGVGLSYTHVLRLSGTGLLVSLAILVPGCYLAHKFMAWMWDAATNTESWLITALILCCILPPATTLARGLAVLLAGILAIASKYMVAWRGKHIFNPAAFGAVVVGLFGLVNATWWVGNKYMLPFTLVLGLLVIRKMRRFQLVTVFALVTIAEMLIIGVHHGRAAQEIITQSVSAWPSVFFASIMLTEPATMPPKRGPRLVFGVLVAVLYAAQLRLGPLFTTPEVALVAGNIFAFLVSPKYKLRLRLLEKHQLSANVYDFVFTPSVRSFHFEPGQYMEWTLPHRHTDGRGNRRTFTIASSPTEPEVHIGVKFYQPSSSFKRTLLAMEPGQAITAGQVAGDFVLPKDPSRKLVFVAGGIGITPFRSQLKYLLDSGQMRDIVLLYLARDASEVSYQDVLRQAQEEGVQILFASSPVTAEQLHASIPDYKARTFYVSGPNAMVEYYAALLQDAGVGPTHIVTDYFSGY